MTERSLGMDNQYEVSKGEKGSFVFGVFSQNLVFAYISAYVMIYYTDYIGISSTTVGIIFFVARLWDAVNDPIMGIVTDKTKSRWGRFRPYLLFVAIPMFFSVFLLFTTSPFKNEVLWAYITYILFGMIYTISDIPLWSLTSSMTRYPYERTKIISLGKAIAPLSFVLVTVITVPLFDVFGGGEETFRYVGMLYAGIMAVGMIIMFLKTRERVHNNSRALKVKDILRSLLINKPLLLILLSQIFITIVDGLVTAVSIYYATYNLGDANLMPVLSLTIIIPMLGSIFIASKLAQRFDKKYLCIFFMVVRVIGYISLFLVGYNSLYVFMGVLALVSLTFGATEVLLPSMMVETIDYIQSITGSRTEGIMWSTQTFVVKAGSSLSGIILGYLLTVIDYIPNAIQSKETLTGMHGIFTLVPAVLILLSLIPILFYPLTKAKYQLVLEKLKAN
ncbi:MFS transporter [Vallitalea okinawensis]|uniref:MFS transporter n=1 Tax=Vallitalea okinawensis TaxID=2078660 RepID=UPI000CFB97A3|nr:glycoside-pentoside-hexuronide (GPH):cation symporter [Vallitalea okinawensis]